MRNEQSLRRTDVLLDLRCLRCDQRLRPILDGEPIRFLCPDGHRFSFDEVRRVRPQTLERGVLNVVKSWEEKSSLLSRIAEDSRERGHFLISESFGRDADQIRTKALRLRDEVQKKPDPA